MHTHMHTHMHKHVSMHGTVYSPHGRLGTCGKVERVNAHPTFCMRSLHSLNSLCIPSAQLNRNLPSLSINSWTEGLLWSTSVTRTCAATHVTMIG